MPFLNDDESADSEIGGTDLDANTDPAAMTGSEVDSTYRRILKFVFGELPLQTATTLFILINTLDIFMTYLLMLSGAIEANPIANYFMQRWGFTGLIAFKLFVVAFVCVIAQVIALKKLQTAWLLLATGSILVGMVVVYSVALFSKHFM